MKAPRNLGRGRLGFNMTPMIDIVFLLIIFFLVSSHLARQETSVELDLPAAASGRPMEVDQTRRLIVNVLPEGELMVGGKSVTRAQLRRIVGVEKQSGGGELEVRIRSDRKVPYRFVEPIMVACARAGVWNVTFAVVPQRGE